MPKVITPPQKEKFRKLVSEGWSIKQAAEKAGFSERTGIRLMREMGASGKSGRADAAPVGDELWTPAQGPARLPIPEKPLLKHELSDIARDCLEDFARFRYRYMGRKSSPWQEYAADLTREKLETIYKEYGVINVAPGAGKSTTFTHDIPAWLTARNRSLRGFIGSSMQKMANFYTGRLRTTLETPIPLQGDDESIRFGLGFDAEAAMAVEYGRFKPFYDPEHASPPWNQQNFTVLQHGETLVADKESTWAAWGWDSGFIGYRVNFIIWDDLVTTESFATIEQQLKMRSKWVTVAERRLEPGGLLILQGQRLGAEDLYRFCKDRETIDYDEAQFADVDVLELGTEELPKKQMYFHIVLPAHKEDLCKAPDNPRMHSMKAPAYDPRLPDDDPNQGCLLDPYRVSWREQLQVMNEELANYRTVWQQEDSDPSGVLVPQIWIDGGSDQEGTYVGCWDPYRGPRQPPSLPFPPNTRHFSYITVDPSPTKFWSIQWWVYVQLETDPPLMGDRFLMDLYNRRMPATGLLDYKVDTRQYEGLLVDWLDYAQSINLPINYLIFEQNAAQRWVLQYSWFVDYLRKRNVIIKAHTTTKLKTDPEYGVQSIRNHYKYGRKRLPGTPAGRALCKSMVKELTHYPLTDIELGAATDDNVMADWFGENNLPRFVNADKPLPNLYQHHMSNYVKKFFQPVLGRS